VQLEAIEPIQAALASLRKVGKHVRALRRFWWTVYPVS
jgi:hypothetical protein